MWIQDPESRLGCVKAYAHVCTVKIQNLAARDILLEMRVSNLVYSQVFLLLI